MLLPSDTIARAELSTEQGSVMIFGRGRRGGFGSRRDQRRFQRDFRRGGFLNAIVGLVMGRIIGAMFGCFFLILAAVVILAIAFFAN